MEKVINKPHRDDTVANRSKELVTEFAELINKSFEHCNISSKLKAEDNTGVCSDCAFSWCFSLGNHGCFLVELRGLDLIDMLSGAMKYHGLDTLNIENLIFNE